VQSTLNVREVVLRADGREFNRCGLVVEELESPKQVCIRGVTQVLTSAEHS